LHIAYFVKRHEPHLKMAKTSNDNKKRNMTTVY
jgi:hypothetical protein